MAKKSPIERLQADVSAILKEYGDEVAEHLDEVTKDIGKKGTKALRSSSKGSFGGSGKYARGWTYEVEESRLNTTVTLYNRTPGLPHLLEHGHAKRGGGRVAGRSHIAPVEAELIESYEKEVTSKIDG
jgi:hypothetical protein